MRPLFAILGLLLCLIAARADELPVIRDSEAVQYLGKNVEARGLVVSMPPISECSGDTAATVTVRNNWPPNKSKAPTRVRSRQEQSK